MRILIYGFGPYRPFRDNITEKIVRALPVQSGLRKIVFPVRFVRRQFTGAVETFRPDVTLGLGQCSSGRLLRMENRAINRRRNAGDDKAGTIAPRGSQRLFTSLKLDLGSHGRQSKNAGDYVCNFSMYVILDFIKRRRLPVRYGFVHVPHDYDPQKALRILCGALADTGFKGRRSKVPAFDPGGRPRTRALD